MILKEEERQSYERRRAESPEAILHLLVVDDSAVMRQAMVAICRRYRDIEVRVAADPLIAKSKMKDVRPDVILLDIEMPRMDGLTFLRQIMAEEPIPVVICSALAGKGTETAFRALEEGAVEVVTKPRIALHDFLSESTEMLIDTIRAAAHARCRRRAIPLAIAPRNSPDVILRPARPSLTRTTRKVVAMGASTGGTEALREILEAMPPDAPAIVIVQHMPEVFTAAFAQRLNLTCRIEVKEAAEGDRVIDGRALIAPGNRHMLLRRDGAEYRVHLDAGPLVSRHRPSVDVLFRSVAQAAGANAIGVILTGMGDDGATGLLEMREAGAFTMAQDEASCAVYGMPREAIKRGSAQSVQALGQIGAAILNANERLRSR
jgi:two-component system chemotaxis response regulator CheB